VAAKTSGHAVVKLKNGILILNIGISLELD